MSLEARQASSVVTFFFGGGPLTNSLRSPRFGVPGETRLGLGFRGFSALGLKGLGFKVLGLGCRVWGFIGSRV